MYYFSTICVANFPRLGEKRIKTIIGKLLSSVSSKLRRRELLRKVFDIQLIRRNLSQISISVRDKNPYF
ncbi:hypothetical protein L2E82_47126 [Cichorium intybus]|uniref:Uncharacterized protein n=1 Tax=Cichorium intybus TaxID=13427 RepID=A0ACB8YVB1_CICIN|nr:hypothetical protein L2E82_47126 [Cichorium intybus]